MPSPRPRRVSPGESQGGSIEARAAGGPVGSAAHQRLDRAAFGARFERHAARLWTVAASITGDRVEAEDVLQEAAVVALQKLDTFDPDTDFGAWMGRIVRFHALNRLRRRRRRAEVAGDELLAARPAHVAPPAPGVTNLGELHAVGPWDDGTWDDELVGALMQLRPIARACLLLKVVLELDHRSIAATLGIPEGTAMSHVHRAKESLRRRLTQDAEDPRR